MHAFRDWNASISRLECKHFAAGKQAFRGWKASFSEMKSKHSIRG